MSASAKKKLRKEQNAAQLTEKQLKEQKEAKKLKLYTTIFVVAIIAVLVAGLFIAGYNYYTNTGVAEKNTVAAVIGDHEINSVELSYHYNDLVTSNYNTWQSTYGDSMSLYLSLMGLDVSIPLSEQYYDTERTWADYFMDSAMDQAHSVYLLSEKARAEGFTLSEEAQAELTATTEQLPMFATIYGYANVDSYLRSIYGPGAEEDSYYEYSENSLLAQEYYNAYAESLQPDDAAIRAYEADKYDEYSSFSYATYRFNYYDYLTGGTEDEDGTIIYSDAENEAARAAAKADAEAMPVCTTVEELNAAISALAINADSDVSSTVYTDSLYSTTSTVAREWLADENRKSGDFNVFPSETTTTNENGETVTVVNDYYAVLFIDRNDNNMPLANVRHILVNFEGGTTDDSGNTTYSDAEKAAALEEAEALLDLYQTGMQTEDAFAELATANSDDYGSTATGGLYENITPEQGIYVESFTNWAVDPEREAGDTGIIESEYGYHVMYYVGDGELSYRDYMISEDIRAGSLNSWYNEIMATETITAMDTSRINKDLVLAG